MDASVFSPMFGDARDWSEVDVRMRLPDDDRLVRFAKAIEATHRDQSDATRQWRRLDHRILGLKGERSFARLFRLPMDLTLKKYGNNRRNFTLSDGRVVDVVTRTYKRNGMWPDLTIRHKATTKSKKLLWLVVWTSDELEPYHAGYIPEAEAHRVGSVMSFKEGIENTVVPIDMLYDPRELLAAHNPESPYLEHEYMSPVDFASLLEDKPAEVSVNQPELW